MPKSDGSDSETKTASAFSSVMVVLDRLWKRITLYEEPTDSLTEVKTIGPLRDSSGVRVVSEQAFGGMSKSDVEAWFGEHYTFVDGEGEVVELDGVDYSKDEGVVYFSGDDVEGKIHLR